MNGRYIEGVAGGRCEMASPLLVREQVIGVLNAEATEPGVFNEDDLSLFSTFASWAAIALQNADVHSQLQRKNAALDRSVEEMNRLNQELRDYAVKMERTNQELESGSESWSPYRKPPGRSPRASA